MFDVQSLMAGRQYQLSPEDYVPAALFIYIDVIAIFTYILDIIKLVNN